MHKPEPVTLEGEHVRLLPMTRDHVAALELAAKDGELWNLRVTSVTEPGAAAAYVDAALKGCADGHMLPFAVEDKASGTILVASREHGPVKLPKAPPMTPHRRKD